MGDKDTNKTSKEELKEILETGDHATVMSTMRKILTNAIELKISTITVESPEPKAIKTRINLLEGDIETVIHTSFLSDPNEVTTFHKEQVIKAEKIIATNIETLKSLTNTIIQLLN